MVGASARRQAVVVAMSMGLSQRSACALLGFSRSALRRTLLMPGKDAPYLEAMRHHAMLKPRYGYRRIRLRLLAEGISLCAEKALRLWRKGGLCLARKRPRKRPPRQALALDAASAANEVWAYDFVHDNCANGQVLKCLTVIDEYSREALAIDVAGSIRSERVIELLSRLISERGLPKALRSDNGPEFIANKIRVWAASQGLFLAFIDPGKPWKNGFNESFNGKFRDECLSVEWFRNRREARVVIEQWRREYNTERPHSGLGNMTPIDYAQKTAAVSPACHGTCFPDIVSRGVSGQVPRHSSAATCNKEPIQV